MSLGSWLSRHREVNHKLAYHRHSFNSFDYVIAIDMQSRPQSVKSYKNLMS